MLRQPRSVALTAYFTVAAVFAGYLCYRQFLLTKEADCPNCGPGSHVVPISYGYPVWEHKREDGTYRPTPRGPYRGLDVTEDSKKWYCIKCKAEWGQATPDVVTHRSP